MKEIIVSEKNNQIFISDRDAGRRFEHKKTVLKFDWDWSEDLTKTIVFKRADGSVLVSKLIINDEIPLTQDVMLFDGTVEFTVYGKRGDELVRNLSEWFRVGAAISDTSGVDPEELTDIIQDCIDATEEAREYIGTVEGRFESIEGDVTSLDGRMTVNEGDITGLDGRVTTAEGDITGLQGDVSSLNERVSINEGDISSLDGRVSAVEGDISTHDGRVTALETDLPILDGRVTVNEGDISALDGRVTATEADISLLKANDLIKLNNIITDGNFPLGTTAWERGGGGTLHDGFARIDCTVSSNVSSVGTTIENGKSYFFRAKAKQTDGGQFVCRLFSELTIASNALTPLWTEDWTTQGGILTATADGDRLRFGRISTIGVVDFTDIILIDLSVFGAKHPTASDLDLWIDEYFEGTKQLSITEFLWKKYLGGLT